MSLAVILPLVPLAGAGVLVALRHRPAALAPVAVASLVATIALGVAAAATEPAATVAWGPRIGLGVAVEGFGRVMVVLVPLVAAPIVAYAAATEMEGRARLLTLMTAFVAAMLVLVTAADFLTLLIAWELVGALSWALISHGWRDPATPRAAAQAFLTTRLGDLGLYLAAGSLFAATGSFAFEGLGGMPRPASDLVAAGVLVAAAAKSAQVPFSPWLFAAMAGPTPVSALLHSATLVASGAYLLIRLASALEPVGWFLPAVGAIGLVTALAGGVVATLQRQAKPALAASTSAQYGLMFAAVGAGFPIAAGAQLVAHAAFKSLLFLGAGIAIHARGTGSLDGLRLGRSLPRVALLSGIGALALAAVPPLGAAWSKAQVAAAAVESSAWLGAGVLVAGFLSALYAARYQLLTYGSRSGDDAVGARSSRTEIAAMSVLAGVTVGLSALWLPGVAALIEDVAPAGLPEAAPWEAPVALALVAAAIGVAMWLDRQARLVTLGLPPGVQAAAEAWLALPTLTTALVVRPVAAFAGWLRGMDERVVDAGVRGAALVAASISRIASLRVESGVESLVGAIAGGTLRSAVGSGIADDRGIDVAVESIGRGVGAAGHQSQRLQTGMSHRYFLFVAAGLALTVVILAFAR